MKFKEFGNKRLPTIILLHGGGLSWWSLQNVVDELEHEYHIVLPIIDGHGEDGDNTFISIQESANTLISYIDQNYSGQVYAIGGLSLGAQIVTQILSIRKDITKFAIIESALVYPIKGTAVMTVPMFKLLYGLIKKKWFSKLQAKSLCVPEELFDRYYKDSLQISKQSLINITLSNGNYNLNNLISKTEAKVLIIVGSKELNIMKKSAKLLHETVVGSELYIANSMSHGEISLVHSRDYVSLLKKFFKNN
ncbi:alpha/beta fold hydrolase [Anaerosacchariphilus polymeriproducens]|uniref:Alpha/beta hydrolase n=1 Tax=Anaerosacchariphilus polymeriproducens TaxID=1812858 RepID=A0A371AVG8_9FIRM|nr:alpha/beta hydrolase [Anaerosacchariphilus polymeriproducens]RDU23566.1 alpha/beta hydrolase [Anaerosacchariphilus polymeriproducens]